ncbi:MAG: hypothetical protein M1832_002034 [Thelocarpon impressellum]|nr:MAG: hypothetical protein M1832_002034 [Thelocarpon impressellum]
MTGVYLGEVCLIGLFAIGKAPGPLVLEVVLLVFTVLYHFSLNAALDPMLQYLPKTLATEEEALLTIEDGHGTEKAAGAGEHDGQGITTKPTLLKDEAEVVAAPAKKPNFFTRWRSCRSSSAPSRRLVHVLRTMSTSKHSSSTGTTAPWKPLFLSHISKLPSPEFVLTSLQPATDENASVPYVPRLRYLVYRGMWAELPENKRNGAPMNARAYESELPNFTTDARMEKVPQIFASSAGHGAPEQSQGSGGGGPVEAVWWVKDVMTQWRIRGETFVSEVWKRMRVVQEGAEREWSWAKKLTPHFGNLSPGMRGSFKNPPPGTPVSVPPPKPSLALGQQVTDLDDTVARRNFRVVIIRPEVVEQLDLTEDKARRWRFTFVGETTGGSGGTGATVGEWRTEELWL